MPGAWATLINVFEWREVGKNGYHVLHEAGLTSLVPIHLCLPWAWPPLPFLESFQCFSLLGSGCHSSGFPAGLPQACPESKVLSKGPVLKMSEGEEIQRRWVPVLWQGRRPGAQAFWLRWGSLEGLPVTTCFSSCPTAPSSQQSYGSLLQKVAVLWRGLQRVGS